MTRKSVFSGGSGRMANNTNDLRERNELRHDAEPKLLTLRHTNVRVQVSHDDSRPELVALALRRPSGMGSVCAVLTKTGAEALIRTIQQTLAE
jgi:hypothetical protein